MNNDLQTDNNLPERINIQDLRPFDMDYVESRVPTPAVQHFNQRMSSQMWAGILNAIARTGVIGVSVVAQGISLGNFKQVKKDQPIYQELVDEAQDFYNDIVRLCIHQRAILGIEKDVRYQGRVVGKDTQYSDRLLELQSKIRCKEYRDPDAEEGKEGVGGVLAVAPPESKEEWMKRKRLSVNNKVIVVTPCESEEEV